MGGGERGGRSAQPRPGPRLWLLSHLCLAHASPAVLEWTAHRARLHGAPLPTAVALLASLPPPSPPPSLRRPLSPSSVLSICSAHLCAVL